MMGIGMCEGEMRRGSLLFRNVGRRCRGWVFDIILALRLEYVDVAAYWFAEVDERVAEAYCGSVIDEECEESLGLQWGFFEFSMFLGKGKGMR